jgi:hypothetical protein
MLKRIEILQDTLFFGSKYNLFGRFLSILRLTHKIPLKRDGEWSRDRISWDRNRHFSTFWKIDEDLEKALGALRGLG